MILYSQYINIDKKYLNDGLESHEYLCVFYTGSSTNKIFWRYWIMINFTILIPK